MDGLIARVEIIIISHGDQNSNWSKITEYQVLLCFIRLPWVWAPTVQILILNLCNQDHFSKKIPTNRIARSHFFQLCSAWCAGNIAKIQKNWQTRTTWHEQDVSNTEMVIRVYFQLTSQNYPLSALPIVNLYFYN